jgi:ceramide glucosyltransferase
MTLAAMAAGAAGVSLFTHALSASLALRRCAGGAGRRPFAGATPPISVVQPHRGVETFSNETLESIFRLDYPDYEILFCVAAEADPIVPLLRQHIAAFPARPARILIGDHAVSGNPKLNNCVKGWKAAAHEWVVLADSNVLMPPDYLTRLLARWRDGAGLVCSPPIGARPHGFAAHLECAFLNTYQARWQYAAEAAGFGFAQGKTMLWRKPLLDQAGGVEALGAEIAEDAAATKLVRGAGLSVHLVDRPFPQPLGRRSLAEVWKRQVRWARLRRATFAPYFLPELFTTSLVAILCAGLAAPLLDVSAPSAALTAAALWYAVEAALASAAGWPLGRWTLPAWIARDILLPLLWVEGLASDRFEWKGAALSVTDVGLAETHPEPSA